MIRLPKNVMLKMRHDTENQTVRDLLDYLQQAYGEIDALLEVVDQVNQEAVKIVGDTPSPHFPDGFIKDAKKRAMRIVELCISERKKVKNV